MCLCVAGQGRACPQGQWECDDGNCISAEWRCDADGDCLDGSDETECQSMNTLQLELSSLMLLNSKPGATSTAAQQ